MSQPTLKDFIYRVGGALVLFLVVIISFNKFAPSYVGIAVYITSAFVILFVGLIEYKSKKKRELKKKRKKRKY